jgi:hypothetical protein
LDEVVSLHLLQVVAHHPPRLRVVDLLAIRVVQVAGRDLPALYYDVVEDALVVGELLDVLLPPPALPESRPRSGRR